MENIQEYLQKLEKQLNLTQSDQTEHYLLTPEEEKAAILNAIEAAKKHAAWKMADKGLSVQTIELRLLQTNWEAEIDRNAILSRANSNKNYSAWERQQRENEKQEQAKKLQELKSTWTAKKVFDLMAWTSENAYGKKLIVDDDTTKLIKTLCLFLSEDKKFETELGLDLTKGLLIRGVSGIGKTHLVKCVAGNGLNPIAVESMIKITEEVRAEGEYEVSLGKNKILYLDDVGTEEPTVKHFGTNVSWFKNFIESYYLKNLPFRNLIISTNNSFSEIEEKYGFRVRSRMKDMFNVIDIAGRDLRGISTTK